MNTVTQLESHSAVPSQRRPIRFPARSFLAFALTPEAPLDEWLAGLDSWTENSPAFFAGRPVVLDLNLLKPEAADVRPIVALLAERGIRIYAIEANGLDMLEPDLPPLLKGARPTLVDENIRPGAPARVEAPEPEPVQKPNTLIISNPVRSGQSVYHPQGDVIIVGSVASGSEIVAGGSVHVYGTLRGRAIAGVNGNSEARIFCLKNEAELLAVDGWYRTADDMGAAVRGRSIQVSLKNGAIEIATLS